MSQKYEITIGIECHVQLATQTKLFSEVDNDARGKEPNSCVSPVDYALPGMLPRLNERAIDMAITAGLAMNAKINERSRFDRKHYYYPDLPKGYQISQLYQPIIGAGFIVLPSGAKIRIEHAHLEEDAGKLSHFGSYSLVDLNRAGTPLIEIVSMPDIHSAAEARDYCKELWRIMLYAGVCLGDLYNGNMRFDVNISLALPGAERLGTRAEIKNLNSFRSVERAVEYEYTRQAKILDEGGKVKQETRGYSDATGKTTSQRSKEEAQDYRYMPEPDIPPIVIDEGRIAEKKSALPLLPADYRQKFAGLIPADILEILLDYPQLMQLENVLLESIQDGAKHSSEGCKLGQTALSAPEPGGAKHSFAGHKLGRTALSVPEEECSRQAPALKLITNLLTSVLLAEENTSLLNDELPTPRQLLDLAEMNMKNELSSTGTKEVFLKFFDPEMHYKDTRVIASELGVIQENDLGAIEAIVDQVIADPACQKAVADYRSGQEKVLGFLTGQVMKASRGKANPSTAQEILKQKLS